jgi:hypothetical protein
MRMIPMYIGKISLQIESIRSIMRCNLIYTLSSVPPDRKKIEALRSSGALNRHPEKVRNPLFTENEFFDPHDLVQLKYETVRAVEVDGHPIVQAALDFGLSRPTMRDDPRALRASTYHPPLDITGLIPRSYNTRQSAASILVQLKAVGRFHRSEAGCNRGILIQTAKTI